MSLNYFSTNNTEVLTTNDDWVSRVSSLYLKNKKFIVKSFSERKLAVEKFKSVKYQIKYILLYQIMFEL